MSLLLIIQPLALDDLEEAYRWHEEQRRGLGIEFMQIIESRLEQVRTAPKQFPRVRAQIRRAIVNRFPTPSSSSKVGS